MSVRAWCQQNGISNVSYYFHQRKIRETVLEEKQIVPVKLPSVSLANEITIESENIRITLLVGVSPEQLTAILRGLKSC